MAIFEAAACCTTCHCCTSVTLSSLWNMKAPSSEEVHFTFPPSVSAFMFAINTPMNGIGMPARKCRMSRFAGKSSLLAAALGELTVVDGQVTIEGSIAYVPQKSWIVSGTIRCYKLKQATIHPDTEEHQYKHSPMRMLPQTCHKTSQGARRTLLTFRNVSHIRQKMSACCSRLNSLVQRPYLAYCRENILLGRAFDEERYQEVLRACALVQDMQQLHDSDMTHVGDRGAALSGGQQARLALARAVYQV